MTESAPIVLTHSPGASPFDRVGGAEVVMRLAQAFYDAMEKDEPALAALHELDEQHHIPPDARERFGLFLMGWLGGPQDYMAKHGHPRLRMRHAEVVVNIWARDAWLRAMQTAMNTCAITGPIRTFLDQRFAQVADFLRNTEG